MTQFIKSHQKTTIKDKHTVTLAAELVAVPPSSVTFDCHQTNIPVLEE